MVEFMRGAVEASNAAKQNEGRLTSGGLRARLHVQERSAKSRRTWFAEAEGDNDGDASAAECRARWD